MDNDRLGPIAGQRPAQRWSVGASASLTILSTALCMQPVSAAPSHLRVANFDKEDASPEVRQIANWVVDSRNNGSLPFTIVDKVNAKVFVFTPGGNLLGAASALLGSALGDDSAPGIGDKKLSNITPEERTTPAGRFVATMGRNIHGKEILWVDYGLALSMHRVITSNAAEHRAERLASPSLSDKRITYGCINVSEAFYLHVVHPVFSHTDAIVYVLPETRPAQNVFHSYIVDNTTPSDNPSVGQ